MAWTLRNVLQRPPSTATTPYWLNQHGAGLRVCVDVHAKKASANFGGRFQKPSTKTTLNEILQDIEVDADRYQVYLNESHNLNATVSNLITRF